MLSQIDWDQLTDEQLDQMLSQLEAEDDVEDLNDFAQVHSESESGSGSESHSESQSESDSDSDAGLDNLELAQQMQELNYLNALGTINAAQVQAMQQYGAMGMGMGMSPMGGQMAAQTGASGMSFA